MSRHWPRAVVAILLTALLSALGRSWGALPPMGPFLDPWHGVWGVADAATRSSYERLSLPIFTDSVTVAYDARGVPHVFASNLEDAYRAEGYVIARDRLFQMDLTTRAAAGRLTEWAGARALPLDHEARELGLAASAEADAAALPPDSPEWRAAVAFAEGVNARLDAMGPRDLPFEYHLLHTRPERWRPVKTFYLLKEMSRTLSLSGLDLRRARVATLVGRRAAEALFPLHNPIQEPIVPGDFPGPRLRAERIPPPGRPGSPTVGLERSSGALAPAGPAQASNSWAVAPERSATGYALLAGDPHLDLSLPSIWYEIHLVVPDTLDVYGVTFPGAPGVVIGFNRDLAWTFTNNGVDVVDFFAETVDDSSSPRATRYDDGWRPVVRRVEEYHGPGGSLLATDTLFFSHRGPLIVRDGAWLSLRWAALDPSRTFGAILRGNQARDADAWLAAMAEFDVPAQNALVATHAGTIAVLATGRVPERRDPGAALRPGQTSDSDWRDDLPLARLPFARNPEQGFLVTANQEPVDPDDDSTYLGRDWPAPWRAMRINELLRQTPRVSVDDMRRFQTDPVSARAGFFIPYFLAAAERSTADTVRRAGELLRTWRLEYTPDDERAVLFEAVMEELAALTWDELAPPRDSGRRVATPGSSILAALMADPDNPWWDRRASATVEDRDSIVYAALAAGLRWTVGQYGEPEAGGWRWDRVRRFDIPHLLRLPGLGAGGVVNRGGPSTISPMGLWGSHGASWRMVVELGPTVRAWTTYPGGQSGNPASAQFTDRLSAWSEGRLDSALVPRTAQDLDDRAGTLLLVPEQ